MGIFRWLFGRSSPPRPSRASGAIAGGGYYDFDIVGESNYQDALDRICGGKIEDGHEHECTAMLVEEPTNQHDANAVKVMISGQKVGYLSRRAVVAYKRALASAGLAGKPVRVDALILGGWKRSNGDEGHYGVKLDMNIPPDFLP